MFKIDLSEPWTIKISHPDYGRFPLGDDLIIGVWADRREKLIQALSAAGARITVASFEEPHADDVLDVFYWSGSPSWVTWSIVRRIVLDFGQVSRVN